ncbi:hypothetical protein BaRGS_00018611 [Batillaria attramentaria]|uniref:MAM domain-containing protein n=1 Tax=Batillaria attramentaria TaxID=370345 RepID=A0ABD0KT53_9CAEN
MAGFVAAVLVSFACLVNEVSAWGSSVDCNFESQYQPLCGYTGDLKLNDKTQQNFTWDLHTADTATGNTGPDGDHTTGTGHYIYTEATGFARGKKANLVTPILAWNSPYTCLTFWYNMYGLYVGNMTLKVARPGSIDDAVPVWNLSGNQGRGWKQADVTVATGSPVQFVFEAVNGYYLGDMAIDDIKATQGRCRTESPGVMSTPSPRPPPPSSSVDCNFENNSLCGWRNVGGHDDQLDWTLHRFATPTHDTGPNVDHTFHNNRGHYLYTESSGTNPGDSALLVSLTLSPTSPFVHGCLRFWYHMRGRTMGHLSVFIIDSDTQTGHKVWSVDGDKGNICHGRRQSYLAPPTAFHDYNVDNHDAQGNNYINVCIVDDIVVNAQLRCDFEKDTLCGWLNLNASDDQLDWSLHQGPTKTYNTGPQADHTVGSAQGHYIYIETSSPVRAHTDDTALLLSPTIQATFGRPGCLHFWYNMHGDKMGQLAVYLVDSASQQGVMVWTLSGEQGEDWHQAAVPLFSVKPFQVLIEGRISAGLYFTDMAVDDISYSMTSSCRLTPITAKSGTHKIITLHTHSVTTTDTQRRVLTRPQRQLQEQRFHRLTPASSRRVTSSPIAITRYKGSSTGPFTAGLLIRSTQGPLVTTHLDGLGTMLTSQFPASPNDVCLQFYYNMYGNGMGMLDVKLLDTSHQTISRAVWSRSGDQGKNWHLAQVSLPASQLQRPFKIVFEGHIGRSQVYFRSDMALDDVLTTPTSCPTNGDCSLEAVCMTWNNSPRQGYPTLMQDTSDWRLSVPGTAGPTGAPPDDHTFHNNHGHYLYMTGSSSHHTSKAVLVSTALPPHHCMSFWFHTSSATSSLKVFQVHSQSHAMSVVWDSSHHFFTMGQWVFGQAPLQQEASTSTSSAPASTSTSRPPASTRPAAATSTATRSSLGESDKQEGGGSSAVILAAAGGGGAAVVLIAIVVAVVVCRRRGSERSPLDDVTPAHSNSLYEQVNMTTMEKDSGLGDFDGQGADTYEYISTCEGKTAGSTDTQDENRISHI